MGHYHKNSSRRKFLTQLGLGCAAVGTTSLLSGLTNMNILNAASLANRTWVNAPVGDDYKAMVCILLAGGNDSYNMLIPRDDSSYADYAEVRTNLAIAQDALLPITPSNDTAGKEFGLHPSMTKIKTLFDNHNLAFVANLGAMVEPTSVSDVENEVNLPLGLYSHSDQIRHWHTSVPQTRGNTGWGGRMADLLQSCNSNQDISMNISLSGTNVFQKGNSLQAYAINTSGNGAILLNGFANNGFYETLKRETIDSLITESYVNVLENAYAKEINSASVNSLSFDSALASAGELNTVFDESDLSQELQMVARTIKARDVLGVKRQTFYISMPGFDTHDNILVEHADLMANLADSLSVFYEALEELGLENQVTTFTMSDFSRRLISNGDGTDHAWGGHSLVMGGAVDGKKIYGEYPELYAGAPLDLDQGRILPTTSCDEYFAEMGLWFGVDHTQLVDIYPNLTNFYDPIPGTSPLGFMV